MIAISCDHGGLDIKNAIVKSFEEKGIEFTDFGTYTPDSVDYPEYAYKTAKAVATGECEKGIICCGTGIGVCMVANKVKGVRAATVTNEFCAEMTRRHNDANVLCMGGRVIDEATAVKLADIFLSTPFDGDRHTKRVNMISEIENRE
ncbi:MAG: ribose 5-phosphate isomerase B [Eubacteriales bacterium]|nr:ribose 5-phosphate isomerase B [Eubacteriales bacterium]